MSYCGSHSHLPEGGLPWEWLYLPFGSCRPLQSKPCVPCDPVLVLAQIPFLTIPPVSLLSLLRFVRSNGLASVFPSAQSDISIFLGGSYPPQHQIEFPKKHTLPYFILYFSNFCFHSLAAIIMDVTEITATKGNKWNVMENAKFCHLSRTQLVLTRSGKKHDHKKIQRPLASRPCLQYFSP